MFRPTHLKPTGNIQNMYLNRNWNISWGDFDYDGSIVSQTR